MAGLRSDRQQRQLRVQRPLQLNRIAQLPWRSVDFIIKSNAITGLQFSGTTYPISATLQGKCNIQINRASDGYVLFSAGNYTFSATVTDSGQNGTSGKQFSLIVYDPSGVLYHSVPGGTPIQGGNVVIHSQ